MENVIIVCVVCGIVGGAVRFLRRAKKSGQTCVGCPHAKQCGGCCTNRTESE